MFFDFLTSQNAVSRIPSVLQQNAYSHTSYFAKKDKTL